MKTNFSLLFYMKKQKNYQTGAAPIYLRITVNGKRSKVTTGRSCDPATWNIISGRCNGKKEEVKSFNAYLDSLQHKVFDAHRQLAEKDEPITAERLRDHFQGKKEKQRTLIDVFKDQYLRSWFPALPSYQTFNNRLKRLSEALKAFAAHCFATCVPSGSNHDVSLLDSFPIITCSGERKAKVATKITDKGYCATKSLFYHGLKLHALAFSLPNKMPFPAKIVITPASENDLNVFKKDWGNISNRTFYGDKIYIDAKFFEDLSVNSNSLMLTPVKVVKGQPEIIEQRDKEANDMFSKAVSTVRQPKE